MSKFVNITVSTSLSTDFYFEVDENTSDWQIEEMIRNDIEKELNSQMEKWNIDELEVIINK